MNAPVMGAAMLESAHRGGRPRKIEDKRERRNRWMRDWRRRVRTGAKLCEVSPAVISLLLELRWLREDEGEDAEAIARALHELAADSMRVRR